MINETVHVVETSSIQATKGHTGLMTQLAGLSTTVSNVSAATGGIGRGKMIERDTK